MCENLQLFWGVFRIGIYSLFRRLCCRGPPPVKPSFTVLCLGLTGSGKSTLLAVQSGESTDAIEPTVGFSIKALMFDDCFVDVKELGGGENVRMYWDRYYLGAQAVIFVVDSASDEATLAMVKSEFKKALDNEQLEGLPLLVLFSHQDKPNARSPEELAKFLDLDDETDQREWATQACSASDPESITAGLVKLNNILLDVKKSQEADDKKSGKPGEFSQL